MVNEITITKVVIYKNIKLEVFEIFNVSRIMQKVMRYVCESSHQ